MTSWQCDISAIGRVGRWMHCSCSKQGETITTWFTKTLRSLPQTCKTPSCSNRRVGRYLLTWLGLDTVLTNTACFVCVREASPRSWVLTPPERVFSPEQITFLDDFSSFRMRFSGIPFPFPGTNYQTVWFCGLSNKRPTQPYQSTCTYKHFTLHDSYQPDEFHTLVMNLCATIQCICFILNVYIFTTYEVCFWKEQ